MIPSTNLTNLDVVDFEFRICVRLRCRQELLDCNGPQSMLGCWSLQIVFTTALKVAYGALTRAAPPGLLIGESVENPPLFE